MAKLHGRKGKLYVQLLSTDTQAQPVAHLNKWTFAGNTDTVEVTDFDDTTKTYVAGFSDAKGTLAGFYDDATVQTYAASLDGIPRKFYLYPSTAGSQYFFGTAFFDFSASGGTAQAVDMTGNWTAATSVQKVG